MIKWGVPVAAVIVVVAMVTGCGTGGRQAGSATAAEDFLNAVGSGDARTACALLAPDTRQSLTSGGTPCAAALTELHLPAGELTGETSVWADRALARTSSDTIFLVELATGWRVAAAGCTHRTAESYRCALESG